MSALGESWPGGATAALDVTYTQANAAGGSVIVDITPGASNEFRVLYGRVVNSGTNTVVIRVTDADDDVVANFSSIASGAATASEFPYHAGATTSGTIATGALAGSAQEILVSGTDRLTIQQTGAGAQNDTFRILMRFRIRGAVPTVSKARSSNEADVTVTAGSATLTVL